jgi:hypothetical protein
MRQRDGRARGHLTMIGRIARGRAGRFCRPLPRAGRDCVNRPFSRANLNLDPQPVSAGTRAMPDLDAPQSPHPTNGPRNTDPAASTRGPAGTGGGAVATAEGEDDPLTRLHRMSRTAGLGTQDYVAINPTAVTALFLGFASALAMLFPVLLIIALAGIICGLIALWQIRNSGGTQTGRGIAWAGIALCLLFTGIVGSARWREERKTEADRQAVMRAVEQFGNKMMAEDFAGAYALTGEHFQNRVTLEQFQGDLRARFNWPSHGKITSMKSNGRVSFESDEQQNRYATTQAIVTLTGGREDRPQIGLSKQGDTWLIEGFAWFPIRGLEQAQ